MLQDMMSTLSGLFTDLLNRSLVGGLLVVAVLLLRMVLKKSPKWVNCLLWGIVAVGLVCPMWFASPVSVYNAPILRETVVSGEDSRVEYFHYSNTPEKPMVTFDVPVSKAYPANRYDVTTPVHTSKVYLPDFVAVWLIGMVGMAVYGFTSYVRLRRQTAASIEVEKNVFLCDTIDTPFILGILRPRIFLPSTLSEVVKEEVIAHEKAHLSRRDHWWKPLGYVLLTLHWFNPLLWAGYVTLCRDIELACDERVCRDRTPNQRKRYAEALLLCSLPRGVAIAACPLAFGEVGVKERVKTVAKYKKPAFWAVILGILVCIVTAVCFLTRPSNGFTPKIEQYSWECSKVLNDKGEVVFVNEKAMYEEPDAEVRNYHLYAHDGKLMLWDWQAALQAEWQGIYKKDLTREFYTLYDYYGEAGHAEVSTTNHADGTKIPTLVMTLDYGGETYTCYFDGAAEGQRDENAPDIVADMGTEALRTYYEKEQWTDTRRHGYALHYLSHGDVPTRIDYENGTGLRTVYGMAVALALDGVDLEGEQTETLYQGPVKLTIALNELGDWVLVDCETENDVKALSLPREIRQMVDNFDDNLWEPLFERAGQDALYDRVTLFDESETQWDVPLRDTTVRFALAYQELDLPYLKANFAIPVFRCEDGALEAYLRESITEPLRSLHLSSPLDKSHLISSAVLQDELANAFCSADERGGYFWYREDYQYLPFGETSGGEHAQTWLIDPVKRRTLTLLDLFPGTTVVRMKQEEIAECLTRAALKHVQKLPDGIQWENVAFSPKESELLLILERSENRGIFEVSIPWEDITTENGEKLENIFKW